MKRKIQFLAVSSILLFASSCSSSDETTTYADGSDLYESGLTFQDYDCTEDCSGHEAGYAWAEENYITDPNNCGGNSQSFIEGCIAYAEENGGGF